MSSLVDHLSCPVCMGRLQRTHMTACGHRYCESCIRECIDRLRRCPCCNTALRHDQLIKDAQFDALIDAVKQEEAAAEKRYFDGLIHDAAQSTVNSSEVPGESGVRKLLSPIEEVLKGHLKRSLAAHDNLLQELQRDVHKQQMLIDEELRQSIDCIKANAATGADIDQSLEDAQNEAQKQKKALEEELNRCCQLVAEAYDRYLNEHVPELAVLPVTVTLSLLNKGIQIPDVRLKPQDSIEDIKRILTEEMSRRGDTLLTFGDDIQFLYFSPFVKKSLYEMTRMASDMVDHQASCPGVIVLPSACLPVMQFAIRPGSEIAVYGTVTCESDIPKKCFSTTFLAEDRKAMDYFNCKSCKINWICRPCMDVCHKDHEIVPYIFGHQPTWACCYCKKKKNCQILL